jgi:hypothetical protein
VSAQRARRRRVRCEHQPHLIQVAYTQTGVGRFRTIEWCARCGALVFRDHSGAAGEGVAEEWRRPTLITQRTAARSSSNHRR